MKITIEGQEFECGRHDKAFYGWWAKPVGNADLWDETAHGFTRTQALALAYERWVLKKKPIDYGAAIFRKHPATKMIKELLS